MKDITNIIKTAKKSIILTDNFIDDESFKILSKKNSGVAIKVYSNNALAYNTRNIKRRKCFKECLNIFFTSHFTDYYIIIDEKIMYHISRPIKFNNRKGFNVIRVMDYTDIENKIARMKKCEENCRRYGWHRKWYN